MSFINSDKLRIDIDRICAEGKADYQRDRLCAELSRAVCADHPRMSLADKVEIMNHTVEQLDPQNLSARIMDRLDAKLRNAGI